MSLSKRRQEVSRIVHRYHAAIESVINAACRYVPERSEGHNRLAYKLQDLWRQLNEVCERQERAHRGPSFRRYHRKALGVDVAARYFAAVAVTREVPELRTWWTACDIRDDWRLGYALGEAFAELGLWSEVIRKAGPLSTLADVDYASDIVGEVTHG